jgi:sulfite oxidase
VIRGYALPSGETPSGQAPCTIAKVELSHNGGMSWTAATLMGQAAPFAWQHWTANIELPRGTKQLIVRATDTRGNTMPQRPEWNLKGYLYNGWHRVSVEAT